MTMNFIDQVKLYIKAGDGGNGMVAFRREPYVPKGGPAGGNGGHGASVYFEVDEGMSTLLDLRYAKHIRGKSGGKGQSKSCHGANAEDVTVKVPPGTIVRDEDTGLVVADLLEHGQRMVICKGGRGGRGNKEYATSRNPAPKFAENGEPGQERNVVVELKLLADVGLVGFPSVGKSTILSVTTAAKPKIADYHFTTIAPNLGVVKAPNGKSFVMADLPGLIEGASSGSGLGHQFLRHIERTRVIVHVLDMSGYEGRDPIADFKNINSELEAFNASLMKRPQVIVANKMDIEGAKENLELFKMEFPDEKVFEVSAITHQGLDPVLYEVSNLLETTPYFDLFDEEEYESNVLYKFEVEEPFIVTPLGNGVFELGGSRLIKLFKMTNFDQEDAAQRFARKMKEMGVDEALRESGCKNGDTVKILEHEFEFLE